MSTERTPCQIENSPARITTETFVNAVSTVYLRCDGDFAKFCSLLELKADKYSQAKWYLFNELLKQLNNFDLQTLARIVEVGSSNFNPPVPLKRQALVEPPPLAEPPPPKSSNEISP